MSQSWYDETGCTIHSWGARKLCGACVEADDVKLRADLAAARARVGVLEGAMRKVAKLTPEAIRMPWPWLEEIARIAREALGEK